MKKFLSACLIMGLLTACFDNDEHKNNSKVAEEPIRLATQSADYAQKTFKFDVNNLSNGCSENSEMVCAINLIVKCAINPDLQDCQKFAVPEFVLMKDESIQRPTETEYKIVKLKPLANGQIEVYTQSKCNGTWFGLCNGNIIYVMEMNNGKWQVKNLYARQLID